MMKPNIEKALFFSRRQLSELVCDAVNLEGIPFTLPEVQTLLDGITVGGHKLTDQTIATHQADAWRLLFSWVETEQFAITQEKTCALHAVAAAEESLTWGQFRTSQVHIAGTNYTPPPAEKLNALWESMLESIESINDIFEQAFTLFLQMARQQFFYDVNKRTGRFMMNGHLLSHGYPVLNVPARSQQTFNTLMLAFYDSNDMIPMMDFLRECYQPNCEKFQNL